MYQLEGRDASNGKILIRQNATYLDNVSQVNKETQLNKIEQITFKRLYHSEEYEKQNGKQSFSTRSLQESPENDRSHKTVKPKPLHFVGKHESTASTGSKSTLQRLDGQAACSVEVDTNTVCHGEGPGPGQQVSRGSKESKTITNTKARQNKNRTLPLFSSPC